MQDVPMRPFLIGFAFASFLSALLMFAVNFSSRLPNYEELEGRYEVYEYSVTETRALYDVESKRTLLWTPGNPRVKVTDVRQVSDDSWQVTVQAVRQPE